MERLRPPTKAPYGWLARAGEEGNGDEVLPRERAREWGGSWGGRRCELARGSPMAAVHKLEQGLGRAELHLLPRTRDVGGSQGSEGSRAGGARVAS